MPIIDTGLVTAERMLNDTVFQKAISAQIMEKGFEGAKLYHPDIVTTADMHGDLEIILPGINSVMIHEDVAEGQEVGITNARFCGSTLKLAKCTAIISVTDEAVIRSGAHGIDAFGLQQKQAEDAFARRIDKQIVTALNQTPQAGTSISLKSDNIYTAFAEAEEKIEKDITGIVCSPQARTLIFSNVNKVSYTGSNPSNPYNGTILPGANVPIYASRAVTTNDLYFVSSKLDPVIYGTHAPQRDTWRNHTAGTINLRIDNFTGALSNYWQTESNTAAGVVKTAWTTT